MPEKVLVAKNLCKKYGDTLALNNVSFDVKDGEFFAVIGPSPSGKTVLLKCIMGIETPDSGSIYIDGVDVRGVPTNRRGISLVFQDMALFPHMRVFDNIAFGPRMRKHPKDRVEKEVDEVMKLVGLEGLGDRYPRQLSVGQQQRVALARSLVVKPKVLLFDEPLGNLDLRLRVRMIEEFKLLHQRIGFTGLYVTHDQEQAMVLADRIMVMNLGRIEQIGTPHGIYTNPETLLVARFVGKINMLKGKIQSVSNGKAVVETGVGDLHARVSEGVQEGAEVAYTIRPEKVLIGDPARDCENRVQAKLVSQIYQGSYMEYLTQLPNETMLRATRRHDIIDLHSHIGKEVSIGWNSNDALAFVTPS